MDDLTLQGKLQSIVWDYTNERHIRITPETVLLGDLGLNSYELVQIVAMIEEEFDIEVPDRVMAAFKTAGDVLEYLKKVV